MLKKLTSSVKISKFKILFFLMNLLIIAYGILKYDLNQIISSYYKAATTNGLYALGLMAFLQVMLIFSQVLRLKKISGDSFLISLRIYIAGAAANAIIPMRIGDGYRLISAAVISAHKFKRHVAAILYERGVDLYYIGVLVIYSVYLKFTIPNIPHAISILFILCLVFALSLSYIGIAAKKLCITLLKNFKAGKKITRGLFLITKATGTYIQILNIITITINIAIPVTGIFLYFNAHDNVISAGIEVLMATLLIMAVPVTPGAVGIFEITVSSMLSKTLSIEVEAALAFAVLYHIAILMPQVIIFIVDFLIISNIKSVKLNRN